MSFLINPIMKKISLSVALLGIFSLLLFPASVQALDAPSPGTTYSYPLPATSTYVNVVYNMDEAGTALIRVYNEAGNLVLSTTESKLSGVQSTQFCLCPMPSGLYLYSIQLTYQSGNQANLKIGKILVAH